tara:strand:+ start:2870 stop:3451 length:582 start_codon:yes stop_codon:yes gene_type:complete
MLKRLYNFVLRLSKHKYALPTLGIVSFSDSIFFPIPPDIILIPMTLANQKKAWIYASVCTSSSVIGALLGYFIGFFLFEEIGKTLMEFYGYEQKFLTFQNWYNNYGILIILIAGLTPLPYKVFTIMSGFLGLPLGVFILGSVISRGLRYFAICALLWWIGEPIKLFIEKYLFWLVFLFVFLFFGGFLYLSLLQ